MNELELKKVRRFQFLNLLNKKTGGEEDALEGMYQLGQELGFTDSETRSTVHYLHAEGLLNGSRERDGVVSITHCGVRHVEEAIAKPSEPTTYFPSYKFITNIIQASQMHHVSIQQATNDSTQTVSFTSETSSDMKEFLQQLKNALPQLNLLEQDRRQAESEVTTIEAQLVAPRPNVNIIKAAGDVLYGILVGVAGNFATDLLKLLTGFGS